MIGGPVAIPVANFHSRSCMLCRIRICGLCRSLGDLVARRSVTVARAAT